jgi:hypothetical protein
VHQILYGENIVKFRFSQQTAFQNDFTYTLTGFGTDFTHDVTVVVTDERVQVSNDTDRVVNVTFAHFFVSSDAVNAFFQQPFLAHLAFRLLPSLFIRRPSVNISHFNLLLRNHWANCNQTLVEWSLGGPP